MSMMISGFDAFDIPEMSEEEVTQERIKQFSNPSSGAFSGASRGDVFMAGGKKYRIYRSNEAPWAVGATRVGTAGKKYYYFSQFGSLNMVDLRLEGGSAETTELNPVIESFDWFPIALQLREKFLTDEEKKMVEWGDKNGQIDLSMDLRAAAWAASAK